jgi:hypothetical protein
MSSNHLDQAIRQIYSQEDLTKQFTENPKQTLKTLGVDLDSINVGTQIVPDELEVGQICGSVCPGIPVINACIGYEVGKNV